jgi:D-xylose transport system permease protein
MTDTTTSHDPSEPTRTKRSLFQNLEIDTRLLGMIGAFICFASCST